jgi:hypothetical protein
MKYFTYLAISIMVIAVISLFYLKQPNGHPWLSRTAVMSEPQQLQNSFLDYIDESYTQLITGAKRVVSKASSAITGTASSNRKIYKWQDKDGVWHFSDTPNPDGLSVEVKLDLKDINVIVAEDTAILSGSAKSSTADDTTSAHGRYYPESISKLVEDAQKARQELQQHRKELNSLSH